MTIVIRVAIVEMTIKELKMRLCLYFIMLLLTCDIAFARGGRYQNYYQPQVQMTPLPSTLTTAQGKAEFLAQVGRVYHPGGSFGGGSYEGCGMNSTRETAISTCCFWGQRTPIEIGVAKASNGMWYAVVFYK